MQIWNKIAQLARLKMSQEEENLLIPQVQKVIGFFNHISQVPTDSTAPLIHPLDDNISFRPDVVQNKSLEIFDKNLETQGNYIKVPLVVLSSNKK